MRNKYQIQKSPVITGRLYDWRGITVRAGRPTNNGLRHVKVHKLLNGFVRDDELLAIPVTTVAQYLANA